MNFGMNQNPVTCGVASDHLVKPGSNIGRHIYLRTITLEEKLIKEVILQKKTKTDHLNQNAKLKTKISYSKMKQQVYK